MKDLWTPYLIYIFRWQTSTIILYPCVKWLPFGPLWNSVIANFIGGIGYFWIDKWILRRKKEMTPVQALEQERIKVSNLLLSTNHEGLKNQLTYELNKIDRALNVLRGAE